MMDSVVLKAATRILLPLILIFAVYMLLRGHDEPGGGFIGALITCAGFVLYKFSHGTAKSRRLLSISPKVIAMIGLLCGLAAGAIGVIADSSFLTGVWLPAYLEGQTQLPISSVLLFDIGVYLSVLGSILIILMTLEEEA